MKPKKEIPVGTRFDRLVVLREEPMMNHSRKFTVQCDCGTVKTTSYTQLTGRPNGRKSCGCYFKESRHLYRPVLVSRPKRVFV